ncbi:hypothetical protein SCH4B_4353 [Ruegeria sp. TrichCH4B]|nr:hypothetical protein SCH4B_4353 [Ruegeria sp. TrichCH4B]
MKRHKQLISHNPDQGRWGDCYRTCMAMVMGMDPENVPHFCDGDDKDRSGVDLAREWLNPQGFGIWTCFYPEENSLDLILSTFAHLAPGVPVILTGHSPRGVNHCVVVLDGEVFCDPASGTANQTPFVGPAECEGGMKWWWAEVVCRLPHLTNIDTLEGDG